MNAEVQAKQRPPLSQFRVYDGIAYVSGQVPMRDGAVVSSDFAAQTRQVLENLRQAVTAAGSSLDKILKCNCYIRNESDLIEFNRIYREFFEGSQFPARTTLIAVPPNPAFLIEIEAIAALPATG